MKRAAFIALVLSLPPLAACSHDHLNFSVPEGDAALRGDASAYDCTDAGDCGVPRRDAANSGGRVDAAADASGSESGGSGNAAGLHFNENPDGYPTTAGHWAPWCDQMKSFEELCDTGIDEDCDGRVDEFMGLGDPCFNGCNQGVYVCDPKTNSLVCQGPGGCANNVPAPCGDGLVGADEQCDPNAPGEQPGVTCTKDCKRPNFVLCEMQGVEIPDACDAFHTCDKKVGWCVPVTNTGVLRCPKIPVEGGASDDYYPMIEENHECLITCSKSDQCPGILSECYMGFCAAPL